MKGRFASVPKSVKPLCRVGSRLLASDEWIAYAKTNKGQSGSRFCYESSLLLNPDLNVVGTRHVNGMHCRRRTVPVFALVTFSLAKSETRQ